MNWFYDFFIANFQNTIWLACILVALIPALEAKIAIPFAMNPAFWGENALSGFEAFIFSFIGSILPCIFIILITRFIKMKTTMILINNRKYAIKINRLNSQASELKKYLLLTSFVAIPLPLTGVWTGSLIAGFSNLSVWKSVLAIVIGALISCGIMTLLCIYLSNSIGIILIVSLCLIIAFLAVDLLITIFKKK